MMSYLRINVNDNDKELIQSILEKLGCEVSEENSTSVLTKKEIDISPTYLFGKWKDSKLNPATFRKDLWQRKK